MEIEIEKKLEELLGEGNPELLVLIKYRAKRMSEATDTIVKEAEADFNGDIEKVFDVIRKSVAFTRLREAGMESEEAYEVIEGETPLWEI